MRHEDIGHERMGHEEMEHEEMGHEEMGQEDRKSGHESPNLDRKEGADFTPSSEFQPPPPILIKQSSKFLKQPSNSALISEFQNRYSITPSFLNPISRIQVYAMFSFQQSSSPELPSSSELPTNSQLPSSSQLPPSSQLPSSPQQPELPTANKLSNSCYVPKSLSTKLDQILQSGSYCPSGSAETSSNSRLVSDDNPLVLPEGAPRPDCPREHWVPTPFANRSLSLASRCQSSTAGSIQLAPDSPYSAPDSSPSTPDSLVSYSITPSEGDDGLRLEMGDTMIKLLKNNRTRMEDNADHIQPNPFIEESYRIVRCPNRDDGSRMLKDVHWENDT